MVFIIFLILFYLLVEEWVLPLFLFFHLSPVYEFYEQTQLKLMKYIYKNIKLNNRSLFFLKTRILPVIDTVRIKNRNIKNIFLLAILSDYFEYQNIPQND